MKASLAWTLTNLSSAVAAILSTSHPPLLMDPSGAGQLPPLSVGSLPLRRQQRGEDGVASIAPFRKLAAGVGLRGGATAASFLRRTSNLARVSLESAMYGTVYATLALLAAGWVEFLFPRYDATKTYTTLGLFLQVVLQAGANCALAQAARDFVKLLPLPDIDGSNKALPAAGGGVVFAFLMFTRQANWKAKVAALDAMLDKTWLFP